MRRAFKFYWLCLREAWRGSIEAANAWAAIIGALLIWAVLAVLGYRLMLPETFGQGIALTAVCLAAAWIALFTVRFMRALPASYWRERDRADKIDAELKAAQKQPDADGTKWTITELFQHIDPDFLEHNSWQKISDEVRDALSTGRLTMWGRLKVTDSGPCVGPRAALTPIDKTYWYKAYFTYFFLAPSTADDVHCYADRNTGRPGYTDLKVSRTDALAVWPGEPDDIADSYPNVRVADSSAIIDLFDGSERTKLIALLSTERITTWARFGVGTSNDLIKREGKIWNSHSFHFNPKGEGAPRTINQTFLRDKNPIGSSYYDICLNYVQLRRVWPTLQITRTKCDIR